MRIEILLTLLGMGAVTYLTRVLFIVFLDDEKLSPFVKRCLRFVPVAVLTSITIPLVAAPGGTFSPTWNNPYFLAGFLTAGLAAVTRNLVVTVVGGIGFILLLKTVIL
ncbi:MAG: AzlD domain-containing protein [Deltaproteobacteria bacterium]|nr:AzlD domain-containing protein [Candidatus Zymogenaceae bacterium]